MLFHPHLVSLSPSLSASRQDLVHGGVRWRGHALCCPLCAGTRSTLHSTIGQVARIVDRELELTRAKLKLFVALHGPVHAPSQTHRLSYIRHVHSHTRTSCFPSMCISYGADCVAHGQRRPRAMDRGGALGSLRCSKGPARGVVSHASRRSYQRRVCRRRSRRHEQPPRPPRCERVSCPARRTASIVCCLLATQLHATPGREMLLVCVRARACVLCAACSVTSRHRGPPFIFTPFTPVACSRA